MPGITTTTRSWLFFAVAAAIGMAALWLAFRMPEMGAFPFILFVVSIGGLEAVRLPAAGREKSEPPPEPPPPVSDAEEWKGCLEFLLDWRFWLRLAIVFAAALLLSSESMWAAVRPHLPAWLAALIPAGDELRGVVRLFMSVYWAVALVVSGVNLYRGLPITMKGAQ